MTKNGTQQWTPKGDVYKEVLWIIFKLQYCTKNDIVAMVWVFMQSGRIAQKENANPKSPYGISEQRIAQKIRKLYEEGFIDKRKRESANKKGSFPYAFHLLPKGAQQVADDFELELNQIFYPKAMNKSKAHKGEYSATENLFLAHFLRCSSTIVTLHLQCHYLGLEVVYFCTDRQMKIEFEPQVDGVKKKYSIIPDAFIAIEDPNSQSRKRYNFFIEEDRGTQSQEREKTDKKYKKRDIRSKLEAYYAFYMSKTYRRYLKHLCYHLYDMNTAGVPIDELPESWTKYMRVLTISTRGERRLRNMFQHILSIVSDKQFQELKSNMGEGAKKSLFLFNTSQYFERYMTREQRLSKPSNKPYTVVIPTFEQSLEANEKWRSADEKLPNGKMTTLLKGS